LIGSTFDGRFPTASSVGVEWQETPKIRIEAKRGDAEGAEKDGEMQGNTERRQRILSRKKARKTRKKRTDLSIFAPPFPFLRPI
jgi:hypothetical protein